MISVLIGAFLTCCIVPNDQVSEISCDSYIRFNDTLYCIINFEDTSLVRCFEIDKVGFVKKYEFESLLSGPVAVYQSDQFLYVVYRCGTFERRKLSSPAKVQSQGKFEKQGRIGAANLLPIFLKNNKGIEEGTFLAQLAITDGNDFKYQLVKATLSDGDRLKVSWKKEYSSFPMVGYNGLFLGTGTRGSDFIRWLEVDSGKILSELKVSKLSYFYFLDEKTLLTRNQNSFELWDTNAGDFKSRKKRLVPKGARLFGNQVAAKQNDVFSIASLDNESFTGYPEVNVGNRQILRVVGDLVFLRTVNSSIKVWNFKKGKLLNEEKSFDIQPIGLNQLLIVKKLEDSSNLLTVRELNEP